MIVTYEKIYHPPPKKEGPFSTRSSSGSSNFSGITYEFLLSNATSLRKRTGRLVIKRGQRITKKSVTEEIDTTTLPFSGKPFDFLYGPYIFKGPYTPKLGENTLYENMKSRSSILKGMVQFVELPEFFLVEPRLYNNEEWYYSVHHSPFAGIQLSIASEKEVSGVNSLTYKILARDPPEVMSLKEYFSSDRPIEKISPLIEQLLFELVLLYILDVGGITFENIYYGNNRFYIWDIEESRAEKFVYETAILDQNNYFYLRAGIGEKSEKKWKDLVTPYIHNVIDRINLLQNFDQDRIKVAEKYLEDYEVIVIAGEYEEESELELVSKMSVVSNPSLKLGDVSKVENINKPLLFRKRGAITREETILTPSRTQNLPSVKINETPITKNTPYIIGRNIPVPKPSEFDVAEISSLYQGTMYPHAGRGGMTKKTTWSSNREELIENYMPFTVKNMKLALEIYIKRGVLEKSLYAITELWRMHEIKAYGIVADTFKLLNLLAVKYISIADVELVSLVIFTCNRWINLIAKFKEGNLDKEIDFREVVHIVRRLCESKKSRVSEKLWKRNHPPYSKLLDFVEEHYSEEFLDQVVKKFFKEDPPDLIDSGVSAFALLSDRFPESIIPIKEFYRITKEEDIRVTRGPRKKVPFFIIWDILESIGGNGVLKFKEAAKRVEGILSENYNFISHVVCCIVSEKGLGITKSETYNEYVGDLLMGRYDFFVDTYVNKDDNILENEDFDVLDLIE